MRERAEVALATLTEIAEPVFLNVYRAQESSLCSLAVRYDNPIPPRYLAPIDSLKIPARAGRADIGIE
jgi:hypothetical protein